jgi:hypothetical protein
VQGDGEGGGLPGSQGLRFTPSPFTQDTSTEPRREHGVASVAYIALGRSPRVASPRSKGERGVSHGGVTNTRVPPCTVLCHLLQLRFIGGIESLR